MRDEAALFAALGDDTRLGLLTRLGEEPSSIAGLTRGGVLTRQAVTKHLYILEKAGLVTCARLGRESLWELRRQRLEDARAFLDLMSRRWDDRIERLRAHVEIS
ncbi:ArsR family transcriptional regulator [Asticcacaulis sp. AC460]|uniref:ArsR/SmtB family transcription factor n=1 Tax=Asticcacaulis sp. AC460 TaxID=1282360 RepID=UPI0003C3FFE3|nr:helix-turn-helix domain-containing protein [Asticcacaulis sp. AC460]ESQ90766.1 ArsR family transcriptional regulator [Asticcacaulis sp. AC460]